MPPVNDNFANAIKISLSSSPVVIETDNTGASLEVGEIEYGYNSIWYKISPDENYFVSANTFGSAFDTKIAAYTGGSVDNLTFVASNDDAGEGLQSEISFFVEKDIDYYISVGGYSESDSGYIKLTVSFFDLFCSGFSNIYNSNTSSGMGGFVGDDKFAVIDGSYNNWKLLFFNVDNAGNISYAGQSGIYTTLGGNVSFMNGKIICSRNSKTFYIHNITDNNISSVHPFTLSNPDLRYPEPGLGSSGQILLNNSTLIVIFMDINYNYVLLPIKITTDSIDFFLHSDTIIPIDNYFSYPTVTCGCAVGVDKAIICARIYGLDYIDKMVFVAVKFDGVTIQKTQPLQCGDIDGSPIGVASIGNSFCLMYSTDNDIKFVYGEIDDDLNVLFSESFALNLPASNVSTIGSIAYEGNGNYTFVCNYYDSAWKILVSSVNINNFVINKNEIETVFSGSSPNFLAFYISIENLYRNIFITYGDGHFPLSNYGKLYSLSTWKTEDVKIAELFWSLEILHKEGALGMLAKQQTNTVVPGAPGQLYIPYTPAIPSKTTITRYSTKQCEKVG